MKAIPVLLVLLVLASSVSASDRYIQVGGMKLFVVYAPEDSPVRLREYLPAGEKIQKWKHLASVRIYPDLKDPVAYLQQLGLQVKQSHPFAQYQVYQKGKGPLVMDFMTFQPPGSNEDFLEWNLMRARYVEKQGLVVYQYAMRIYEPTEDSSRDVLAERAKMLEPFAEASFEEKEEPNQSPEPTPTAGTSAAEQPLVPAAGVAHL